jgi:hypothetical protein
MLVCNLKVVDTPKVKEVLQHSYDSAYESKKYGDDTYLSYTIVLQLIQFSLYDCRDTVRYQ